MKIPPDDTRTQHDEVPALHRVMTEQVARVRAEAVTEREEIIGAIRDVRMGDALPFNTLPDIIRGIGRQRDWQRELRDHLADVTRRLTERERWLNAQPGDSTPGRLRCLIAAERADAVAEERQRMEHLIDALPNPDRAKNPQFAFGWNTAKATMKEALAVGSVPAATPAELEHKPTRDVNDVLVCNACTKEEARSVAGFSVAMYWDSCPHNPAAVAHRPALIRVAEPSVGTGTPAEEEGFEPAILGPGTVVRKSPAEEVSGGSGHAERPEVLASLVRLLVAAETEVARLTAEVARYRAAIEAALSDLRLGIADLNRTENINSQRRRLLRAFDALAAALGDGEAARSVRASVTARCEHPATLPNLSPETAKCGAPVRAASFTEAERLMRAHWADTHPGDGE